MTDTTPVHEERFPGFDTLQQAHTWDDVTREVVRARVEDVPPVTFFTADEERTARVLLDRLLAHRGEPRVPVVELIDVRLAVGDGDGYRYADMPEDGEAWRQSLAGLDHELKLLNTMFSMKDLVKMMGPNTASYIQMSDQLGTLEPGKLADIVLLDGDPLEGYWNWLKTRVTIKGGVVVVDKRAAKK